MEKPVSQVRINPLVDLSDQSAQLLKTWRIAAIWALPIGILAFLIAIYFEFALKNGSLFDIIGYGAVATFLTVMYLSMFFWPDKLQLIFTVNVVIVSTYYVLKLIYALFINPSDILANITGNFVWAPAVVVIAFFVPKVRGARTLVILFSITLAIISAAYWIPNWISGTNLPAVQVLCQISLSMIFTACLIYLLTLTGQYFDRVEGAAETFQTMALSDELTGLPNQIHFDRKLEYITERAKKETSSFVIAFVNVDRLKSTNSAYGRDVGNELLIQIGKRLQAYLDDDDLVARLHADEFAIISEKIATEKDVIRFGSQILKVFDNPFFLESLRLELNVSASVGISRYPQDAQNGIGLQYTAQQAMQHIKGQGRNGFSASSITHFAEDSLANEIRVELLRGFSWENFQLRYQAIHDLVTKEVEGAEALLSWHSSIGWTPIDELSAALNRSGDIVKIERAVMEHVCFDLCRSFLPTISVSISPLHFAQPDFVLFIRKVLSETGLAADRLTLQVSFATLNSNPPLAQETLRQLSGLGIRLVLVDFGSEFIATSTLNSFPLVGIKIHPKLLATYMLGRDQATFARTLLSALIEQAHELGLSVTAVGVENEVQIEVLRRLSCNYGQGVWWGQPVSSMPNSMDRSLPS